jgi:type VI secretion system secreted protein VgrG
MAYNQENRMIRIATPLGGDELLITGFNGNEGISHLFRFKLSLLSHNNSIAFDSIIGGNVTVSIVLDNGEERFFNGIIESFSQSDGTVPGENGEVFSRYTATMVPWLWLLTRTSDLRIFQEKSAVDIIEQVFREKGFNDYTKKLNGTYSPRMYCVQYRETDFSFISRLLEEEGISYYFSHENGRHTLVLADAANAYAPCPHHEEVRYHHGSGGEGGLLDADVITALELKKEIKAGKFTLNDYNFETPNTKLLVQMEGIANLGPGEKEVYDYPGLYANRAEGEALSKVRIQKEEAEIATITGASDVRGLASGYSFTLEEYFREEMNNKKYLLTRVDHSVEQQGFGTGGSGGNSYRNSFTCIPLDTPIRPPRSTPRPVIEGVQTAMVVGPAGEEIYTDEYGRIKVQFHWDREGQSNEHSSCWMRVSQIWAGNGWGAMYIPRIGHEVIVDFLEGNPDRPIVIGSVYHGTNRPPYPLPDEKTQTTIKSNSSKGGGGFNEIRLEDKKGAEHVYIHGEKDFDLRVKNTRKEYIGNERHLTVEKDEFAQVKKSKHQMVTEDFLEKVGGDMNSTIGGDRVVRISGGDHLTIDADFMMKTGGTANIKSGMKVVVEAGMEITLKAGGGSIIIGPAGVSITGPMVKINSGGSPSSASLPDPPNEPKAAELPVDAKPGKKDKAPEAQKVKEKAVVLDSNKVKEYESSQAQLLSDASNDGDPYCKECEEARQRAGGS